MDRYVDGFVLPVPNGHLDEYREMAADAGKYWMEHGALEYVEAVGDDMEPDMDGMDYRTFPELVDTEADETVVFAYIVFESREHRDEVNAKVMEEMDGDGEVPDGVADDMPFDVAEMAYGGFRSIVSYED